VSPEAFARLRSGKCLRFGFGLSVRLAGCGDAPLSAWLQVGGHPGRGYEPAAPCSALSPVHRSLHLSGNPPPQIGLAPYGARAAAPHPPPRPPPSRRWLPATRGRGLVAPASVGPVANKLVPVRQRRPGTLRSRSILVQWPPAFLVRPVSCRRAPPLVLCWCPGLRRLLSWTNRLGDHFPRRWGGGTEPPHRGGKYFLGLCPTGTICRARRHAHARTRLRARAFCS
jgi:hypothetical protein